MNEIKYTLPKRALDILQELSDSSLNKVMWYVYAAQCCRELGYHDAADFFWKQSGQRLNDQKTLADYAIRRGAELEVNKTEKPEIDDTDFKSILKGALEMEISDMKMCNEAALEIMEIDIQVFQKVSSYMSCLDYGCESMDKAWVSMNADEDQYEFQKNYFAPKSEIANQSINN